MQVNSTTKKNIWENLGFGRLATHSRTWVVCATRFSACSRDHVYVQR